MPEANQVSKLMDEKLKNLECHEFYVKIFDTSSNSYDYTCQNYVPWDDESEIFCTDYKEMPYVIVYSTINSSISITYYKVCCRTKECLVKYRFNPLTRFGKKKPRIEIGPPLSESDVGYLDLMVQKVVAAVFVMAASYGLYLATVSRRKLSDSISDSQEFVDPLLLAIAEKPRMQTMKIGHKDKGRGTPISGLHSFLDYCRVLAAQAYREQNVRESQLIDPDQIKARIIRHEFRMLRENRESNLLRWKIAHNRLNRNRKFVKIGERWVYVSKNMERCGFLERNLKIQQKAAIQRYTDAQKMVLHLKTKDLYDNKWLEDFDKFDITELVNLMTRKNKDKFMIFFNAVGLGHHLFQVHRPQGTVTHDSIFNAMFFHGPYFYPWDPKDLVKLFDEAREKFLEDEICLKLQLPIVLIGEIRGRLVRQTCFDDKLKFFRYADLHRWLQIIGLPYRRKLLFLGGYVDRGSSSFEEYSLECLSFIAALKIAYPHHVFMLRGSAETAYSFAPRWSVEVDDAVLHSARQMTNSMPLLAIIAKKYLATSSGISPFMTYDLEEIERFERPLKPDNLPYLLKWILFSQPSSMSGMFENDEDNGTFRYGLRAVDYICKKWKLKAIIRSRNELTVNPLFLGNEKLITISSTPTKFSGGVVLLIDRAIGYTFFKLNRQKAKVRVPPRKDTVKVYNEIETLSKKQKNERLDKEKKLKEEIENDEKKERKTQQILERWDWVALKEQAERLKEQQSQGTKPENLETKKLRKTKDPESIIYEDPPSDWETEEEPSPRTKEQMQQQRAKWEEDQRALQKAAKNRSCDENKTFEDIPSDWDTVEEEPAEKKARRQQQEAWEADLAVLKKEEMKSRDKKKEELEKIKKALADANKTSKPSEVVKNIQKTPEPAKQSVPENDKKLLKPSAVPKNIRKRPEPVVVTQKVPAGEKKKNKISDLFKKKKPKAPIVMKTQGVVQTKKPKVEDLLKDWEGPPSDWDDAVKNPQKKVNKNDFFDNEPDERVPSQWDPIDPIEVRRPSKKIPEVSKNKKTKKQ